MKPLSITTAWNETAAFVKREAGLLFPIALALIALPAAFLQAMTPTAAQGQPPELGAWLWLMVPVMVLSVIGSLAIAILALGREVVVRDAFSLALRRFLPLLGAALLVAIGAVVFLIPFVVILALLGPTMPASAVLLALIVGLLAVFLAVRLMLMTPVAAAEPAGPVQIVKRSWALTKGHAWKLFGLVLVIGLLFVVLGLAVSTVGGILIVLIAGAPEPGSLAFFLVLLISALLNTVLAVYFGTLVARIYAQLADAPTNGI